MGSPYRVIGKIGAELPESGAASGVLVPDPIWLPQAPTTDELACPLPIAMVEVADPIAEEEGTIVEMPHVRCSMSRRARKQLAQIKRAGGRMTVEYDDGVKRCRSRLY